MAKPILVVNYCIEGLTPAATVNNLKNLQETLKKTEIHDDYFVFMLPVRTDSHVQVFYDKDFDETSYEELKSVIETKLNDLKWKK